MLSDKLIFMNSWILDKGIFVLLTLDTPLIQSPLNFLILYSWIVNTILLNPEYGYTEYYCYWYMYVEQSITWSEIHTTWCGGCYLSDPWGYLLDPHGAANGAKYHTERSTHYVTWWALPLGSIGLPFGPLHCDHGSHVHMFSCTHVFMFTCWYQYWTKPSVRYQLFK